MLVTGVSPGRHGVIGNNYLDRATGKSVTLITDPVFENVGKSKLDKIWQCNANNCF